jgi:hypothetical protein
MATITDINTRSVFDSADALSAAAASAPPRVLVFSIAINGYAGLFRDNIASQRAYAKRHAYRYCVVDKVPHVSATAAAWLKISLINEALKCGYDLVMFIDADCEVSALTPDLQGLTSDTAKAVFVSRGFSGQYNSGVLVVKNTPEAKMLFRTMELNCERDVPGRDWGENGHFIFYSQFSRTIEELDPCWNNNRDPQMKDYIRHYCGGTQMRALYQFHLTDRLRHRAQRCIALLKDALLSPPSLSHQLKSLTLYCKAHHAAFQPQQKRALTGAL